MVMTTDIRSEEASGLDELLGEADRQDVASKSSARLVRITGPGAAELELKFVSQCQYCAIFVN